MATYSNRQAAKILGLLPVTLGRHIASGKLPSPEKVTTGAITVYLWTEKDIERARILLPKIIDGRALRYKKNPPVKKTKK